MQLGVKFDNEDIQLLRETLAQTNMYPLTTEQIQMGLAGYKISGGEPWNFGSMDLENSLRFRRMGRVLPEDPDKMPTPMPEDEEIQGDEAGYMDEGKEEDAKIKRKRDEIAGEDELADEAKGKVWLRSME